MTIALITSGGAALGYNGGTTGAFNTTGANFIVVEVNYKNAAGGGGGVPTFSDSKSNVWTQLTAQESTGGYGQSCVLFYAQGATTGSGHTFTGAGSASYSSMSFACYSGVHATSAFDVQNGAHTTPGGATSLAAGAVTPNNNGSLVISSLGLFLPSGTMAADAPMTGLSGIGDDGTTYFGGNIAHEIQTTATTRNPNWSGGSSPNAMAAAVAVFKASGVGGTAPSLTSMSPSAGYQNTTQPVTLTGTGMGGATPSITVSGTGVTVANLVQVSAVSWTANFVISNSATISTRTVSVTTVDGTSGTVPFLVRSPSAGTGAVSLNGPSNLRDF